MATDNQVRNQWLAEAAARRAANPQLGPTDMAVAFQMVQSILIPGIARYADRRLQPGEVVDYVQTSTDGASQIRMTIACEAITVST